MDPGSSVRNENVEGSKDVGVFNSYIYIRGIAHTNTQAGALQRQRQRQRRRQLGTWRHPAKLERSRLVISLPPRASRSREEKSWRHNTSDLDLFPIGKFVVSYNAIFKVPDISMSRIWKPSLPSMVLEKQVYQARGCELEMYSTKW